MYMKVIGVTRNKEMLETLDLLGLQGTARHPGILDAEDTQVNAIFKDSVKPANWQIILWEDLQVPIAATLLVLQIKTIAILATSCNTMQIQ